MLSACTTTSYLSGQKNGQYSENFGLSASTAQILNLSSDSEEADFLSGDIILARASMSGDSAIQTSTILAMVAASDAACEDYLSGMVTASNSVSSFLGVTTLGLTSAAAVSSPQRSINLLSGIASFTGGTEKELTDTVLGGKSPHLIYKAVKAIRKKERSRIITLATNGGFELAAIEMADYHAQCGPTVGINALEEAVSIVDQGATEDGAAEAAKESKTYEETAAVFALSQEKAAAIEYERAQAEAQRFTTENP